MLQLGLNTDARGKQEIPRRTGALTLIPQLGHKVNPDETAALQSTTEQPVLLGPKMDEKENAPMDPVGTGREFGRDWR